MTEREKALAGMEFIRGDINLKKQRDRAEMLCFEYNATSPADSEKRQEMLDRLIPDKKEGCYIKSPFICEYGEYITLGKNFFANYNCKLMDGGKITFGDNCVIGASSVVVKDIPSNSVAVGNPCKVIGNVNDEKYNHPLKQK